MSSFLDLPAELRFQVYSYTAIPDRTPFTSYIGLYLSCHQIKAEMDSECGKIFRAHLSDLQSRLPGARLDIPNGFLNMQHIRILLDRGTANTNKFRHLCNLYSASTTFVFDETHHLPTAVGAMYWFVACLKSGNSEGALTGRVQLEICGDKRTMAYQMAPLVAQYRHLLGDWRFHWVMKDGVMRGIWE